MKHFAVLILCLITTVCPLAYADDHDIGAFSAMTGIPSEVDAAAVFENPAETILLSPVGRSMRSLLALGGVFTQTESAWNALAEAFDAPVDDTIRSLLSDQVAVVWDGFEAQDPDMMGVTDSFDSRWTIICKVKPEYLAQIRKSLRPVKREIVHARAVYAIEQGRYRVALIDPASPNDKATVLLAPRNGSQLLGAVLAHAIRDQESETSAITDNHEPMLAELSDYHQSIDDGTWSFLFMSRLDIFNALFAQPMRESAAKGNTIAAIVKLNPTNMRCTFVTDVLIDEDMPDAPIELFDAVAPDAVFTLASARAPRLSVTENSLGLDLSFSTQLPQEQGAESIFDAPTLISLSPGDASDMCVTMAFPNTQRDAAETARLSDEAAIALISAFDPAQAPAFNGRFPEVLRQISLRITPSTDTNTDDWPGIAPKLAWQTTRTSDQDLVIAALAPSTGDPASQVRQIAESAKTLDALDAPKRSGVLLRVSLQPAEMLRLVNDPDIMDIALARIVRSFEMGIRRGIESSMRGRFEIRFTESASKPRLGSDDR